MVDPLVQELHLVTELRSAVRHFSRNRGLAVVAVSSLAVSIGVSVAVASVATAVLVRPLPYERPDDLVMIWQRDVLPSRLTGFRDPRRLARPLLTPAKVLRWREGKLPFVDFAVVESWQTGREARVDIVDAAGVERLRGTRATSNVFSVLGVRAALGRTFGEEERDVAVISDRLWRRRFAADPTVLGTSITIAAGRLRGKNTVQIIGVLPDRFRFDYPDETEIWLPLTWSDIAGEVQFGLFYRAVARLRTGISVDAAEAALQAFRDPERPSPTPPFWLETMHDYAVGASQRPLLLIAALTVLLVLSGGVNAATVFAASMASRAREIRIRQALGASQQRLARQVVSEAAGMAALAGAVAVGVIAVALPGLRAALPPDVPRLDEVRLDWSTVAGVCGAVFFSTLFTALAPAWLIVRDRQQLRLEDARTSTLSLAALRLRRSMLGIQFALVTALLVTGSMLVRSFWNIAHVDKGFSADPHVHVAGFQVLHSEYGGSWYERELLRRVRALSYVEAASLTSAIPLRGVDFVNRVLRPDGAIVPANQRTVDPGYFELMGIPLLSGQWLTGAEGEPVALISRSLAEALFPGENPLGKSLQAEVGRRVVGVVGDLRGRALAEPPLPAYYVTRAQNWTYQVFLLVRTSMGAQPLGTDLRAIVREVYPEQPMPPLTTLEQVVNDSVADRRAYAVISGAFAVVMLLLAGVGLAGHLSHVVSERARDLAIRSALGASSRQQRRLLIRHIAPALVGGMSGAMLIVYASFPLVAPFVFDLPRFDALSFVGSALFVAGCTASAVLRPARRIASIDAAAMLRPT